MLEVAYRESSLELLREMSGKALIGAGTILTADQAAKAGGKLVRG